MRKHVTNEVLCSVCGIIEKTEGIGKSEEAFGEVLRQCALDLREERAEVERLRAELAAVRQERENLGSNNAILHRELGGIAQVVGVREDDDLVAAVEEVRVKLDEEKSRVEARNVEIRELKAENRLAEERELRALRERDEQKARLESRETRHARVAKLTALAEKPPPVLVAPCPAPPPPARIAIHGPLGAAMYTSGTDWPTQTAIPPCAATVTLTVTKEWVRRARGIRMRDSWETLNQLLAEALAGVVGEKP